jgi:catechol 2,3-dioxygenase
VVSHRLLSQLAHVELLTPRPQESLDFFTGRIGLYESARAGQSVYLRGRGDYFHHGAPREENPFAMVSVS